MGIGYTRLDLGQMSNLYRIKKNIGSGSERMWGGGGISCLFWFTNSDLCQIRVKKSDFRANVNASSSSTYRSLKQFL